MLFRSMSFYSHIAIKGAFWPTTSAGLTFAGDSYALSFVDSGGNFDIDDSLFWHSAGAFAFFARIGNDLSTAAALSARRDHLKEPAAFNYLTASAARRTSAWLASSGTAAAGAFAANILTRKFDCLLSAFGDVVECQVNRRL